MEPRLLLSHTPVGTSGSVTTTVNVPYIFQNSDFGFTDPNDSPPNYFAGIYVTSVPGSGQGQLEWSDSPSVLGDWYLCSPGDYINLGDYNVRYTPPLNATGMNFVSFGFKVVDTGSSGQNIDTTARTMTVNIIAPNHAPSLSGANSFTSITEDQTTNEGDLVSTLINGKVSDSDANALKGIAVLSITSSTGTWQYSLNAGSTWTNFGSVSTTSALCLRSTDRVRFVPDEKNATTASITFVAWDQTSAAAGAQVNTTTTGGTSAFSTSSATSSITVTAVNDAPTLSGAINMPSINEDNITNTGSLVSALITGKINDVDTGALQGIAITGTSNAIGDWQYSVDGGTTWTNVGTVSITAGLMLRPTDKIRFLPDEKNGGTFSFTFVAWDQSSGTAGSKTNATGGGSSPFSTASATSYISVTPVNDAPIIGSEIEISNDTSPTTFVITVSDFASAISDVDTAAIKGIAIVEISPANAWQYSTDYGATWVSVGTVSETSALLLRSIDKLRYTMPPGTSGGTGGMIRMAAWDQTSGPVGSKVDISNSSSRGGTTAYSMGYGHWSFSNMGIIDPPPTLLGANDFTSITEDDIDNNGELVSTLIEDQLINLNQWSQLGNSETGIAIGEVESGNGKWQYSINGSAWADVVDPYDSRALILSSIDRLRFVPDGKNGTTASISFNGWDNWSSKRGQRVSNTDDPDGLHPFSSNSATAHITVTSLNDAPILSGANNFTTVTEDDTANTGDLVSALISGKVTDVDTGAIQGIAVTATASGPGVWQYSLNSGSSWTDVGTVSATSALLLRPTDRLRFLPNEPNGGTSSVTFVAWDQTTGTAGSKVNASTRGGVTAFSSATASPQIVITSINDAPVLTGSNDFTTITEDQTTNSGDLVSTLISGNLTDVDSGASVGIAVTGSVNGNGNWQYSLDGTTWSTLGTVSTTSALLLRSTDRIRFMPNGQNGTSASVTFVAWDQSSGTAGSKVDASTTGGINAFSNGSATSNITVTSVNDAPVLTGSFDFPSITEDETSNSGVVVSSLVNPISDVDASSLAGIALTGTTNGNGVWQYSLNNGGTWTAVGVVSGEAALLLRLTDKIRFVPDGQNGTSASVTFVAWDQTTGTAGANASIGAGGGSSAFSSVSATSAITVASVNDAPVLSGANNFTSITEDSVSNSGSLVSSLTSGMISDVDGGAVQGIAVSGTSNGNGTWQYFSSGGSWLPIGTVSSTAALLLRSSDKVRFVPNGMNGTLASITFVAWDRTSGTAGSKVAIGTGGGSSVFSSASATSAITVTSVNDAPVLSGAIDFPSITEDDVSNTGSLISALTTGMISDVDDGAVQGIAVSGTSNGNGTWQYFLSGGSWLPIGTVSSTAALLLRSSDKVRFVPNGSNGTSASITFVAWDRTGGTAGYKASLSAGGGSSMFSSANATSTITVNSVNDAPTLTNNAAVTLPTTNEDTTSSVTTVSSLLSSANAADVDTSALQGIAVTTTTGLGNWQYSVSGTVWKTFGVSNSSTNGLLLTPETQLRYVPNGRFGETATLAFKAWDQTAGTASTDQTASYLTTSTSGGTSSISSSQATASIVVTPVHDTPVGSSVYGSSRITASEFLFEDPNDSPADTFIGIVVTTLPAAGKLEYEDAQGQRHDVTAGQFLSVEALDQGVYLLPAHVYPTYGTASFAPFTFQVRDSGDVNNTDPIPRTYTVVSSPQIFLGGSTDVNMFEDATYSIQLSDFWLYFPDQAPATLLDGVTITAPPSSGSLLWNGVPVEPNTTVPLSDIAAGNLTYQPEPNANDGMNSAYSVLTFEYHSIDGTDDYLAYISIVPNTIFFYVQSVNDVPIGTSGSKFVGQEIPRALNMSDFGFTDPDDSPANQFAGIKISELPSHGTLYLYGNHPVTAGMVIPKSLIFNDDLTYTSSPGYVGNAVDSFKFQVQDDGGTYFGGIDLDPVPKTLSINVVPNPTIDTIANQTRVEASSVSLAVEATDPSNGTLYYTASGLPDGLSIDIDTGVISGTVASGTAAHGLFTTTVTVESSYGGKSTKQFTWTINARNPIVAPINNVTTQEGASISVAVSATDPANYTLSYAATGLPDGLAIDPSTGVISGTISAEDVVNAPFTVHVVVSNLYGGSSSRDFTISFANRTPQMNAIADATAKNNHALQFQVVATDPDPSDVLAYSLDTASAAAGMTINPLTGAFSWTPTLIQAGQSFRVTVTATDNGTPALSTSRTFQINVLAPNRPPRFTSTPIVSVSSSSAYSYQATATDADGDTLVYSLVQGPAGMSINPSTGLLTWNTPANTASTQTVTIRVSDNLAVDDQKFTLSVNLANYAPIITHLPAPKFNLAGVGTSATSNITPKSITLDLASNEIVNKTVQVALANEVPKADIFLLLDDTLSFSDIAPKIAEQFPGMAKSLQEQLPGVSLGFGIGRFEDYQLTDPLELEGSGYQSTRPFILNQAIVTPDHPDFDNLMKDALLHVAPGFGAGDLAESYVEALYQIATGRGFDGTNNGSTTESGPAGSLQAQQTPDFQGDVPAFSTLTNQARLNSAGGTIGGVGFRNGALPIILVATDANPKFQLDPTTPTIQGKNGTTASQQDDFITSNPPPGAPIIPGVGVTPGGRGATLQETVDALNQIGAIVVGLGAPASNQITLQNGETGYLFNDYPQKSLTALARLTGSTNKSTATFTDATGDQIAPGDPLYFSIQDNHAHTDTPSIVTTYIPTAIRAALAASQYTLTVQSTDPTLQVTNTSGIQGPLQPGDTATFNLQLTGDTTPRLASLNVVDTVTGYVVGSLPVAINVHYQDYVQAADPEGDTIAFSLVGETYGASIDPVTGVIDWTPTAKGTFQFQVKATDSHGNSTTVPYSVVVGDISSSNHAPTITTIPNATIAVGNSFQYSVQGYDQDGDQLTYHLLDDQNGGTSIPDQMTMDPLTGNITFTPGPLTAGSHVITVAVDDPQGGRAIKQFTLNVVQPVLDSNSKPSIRSTAPTAAYINRTYKYFVGASDVDGDVLTYTLLSAPDRMAIDPSTGVIAWQPTDRDFGVHRISLDVSDGRGGHAYQTWNLSVGDSNQAPVIVSSPSLLASAGTPYRYQATATDLNSDPLTWSIDSSTIARGITIDPATGLLMWNNPTAGDFHITVTVDDGQGKSSQQAFDLKIVANHAPAFDGNIVTTGYAGEPYAYQITASDAEGDPISLSLMPGGPSGLAIDPTDHRTLRWANPVTGTYNVNLIARDPSGMASVQSFTLTILRDNSNNSPPIFTSSPVGPTVVGQTWTYHITVTDADIADTVSLELVEAPDDVTLTNVDATHWTLTWEPSSSDISATGPLFVIKAVDSHENEVDQSFHAFVVSSINPNAPVFTSTPSGFANIGYTYTYSMSTTTSSTEPVVYSLVRGPNGSAPATVVGATLAWSPNQVGSYDFVVKAADESGNYSFQSFTIFVGTSASNHLPHFTPGVVPPVRLAEEWTYQLVATDADNHAMSEDPDAPIVIQDQQTFTLVDGPEGMWIDSSNVVHWVPLAPGQFTATFLVSDSRGGTDRLTIVLPVNINFPPVITSEPVTKTVVGDTYTYTITTADREGDAISLSLDQDSLKRGMRIVGRDLIWTSTAPGEYWVTVTADDGRGGTNVQEFSINAVTSRLPVFTSYPTLDAFGGQLWQYAMSGKDPNGDEYHFSLLGPPDARLDPNGYLINWTPEAGENADFTLTITNSHGDQTIQQFSLTVHDSPYGFPQSPNVISVPNGPALIGELWQYQISATDPNNLPITYSLASGPAGMSVDSTGKVTWIPGAEGNYLVRLLVSNGVLNFTHQFELPATIKNRDPKIVSGPYDELIAGYPWKYRVMAVDPDGDKLTYKITSNLQGFSIDTNHVISWTPTSDQVGVHSGALTVTVSDGKGGEWVENIDLTVHAAGAINGPQAPVVVSLPTGIQYVGQEWQYKVIAHDPLGHDENLRYSLQGSANPAGLSIDSITGEVTFNPTENHVGQSLIMSILVSNTSSAPNPQGDTRQTIFTLPLHVVHLNNPPVITSSPSPQPYAQQLWTYQIVATDPDLDQFQYALDAASIAAGLSISSTGLISWTPTSGQAGLSMPVIITVRDSEPANELDNDQRVHGESRQVIFLTVGAASPGVGTPQITSLPLIAAQINHQYRYQVTVDTHGQTVNYVLATGPTTLNSGSAMQIDASTGLLTWSPTELGNFDVTVQVRVGTTVVDTQQFHVSSVRPYRLEEPPQILTPTLPGPAFRDAVYTATVQAIDVNGNALAYSLDQDAIDRGMTIDSSTGKITWVPRIAGDYQITVTVSNGIFEEQIVYSLGVLQNAAPTIDYIPPQKTTVLDTFVYDVQANDPNSEDQLGYKLTSAPEGMRINSLTGRITWPTKATDIGGYLVTIVVSDSSGASATRSFELQSYDPTKNFTPVITGDIRSSIPVNQLYTYQINASDADGDALQFELLSGPSNLKINSTGQIQWTPTSSDVNNLSTPYEIRVRVTDIRSLVDNANSTSQPVLYAEKTYYINVTRGLVNSAPVISGTLKPGAILNETYVSQLLANDPDNDAVRWTLKSGLGDMKIDPNTGRLTWKPTSISSVGINSFTVQATDIYGATTERTFQITVYSSNLPPQFTTDPQTLAPTNALWTYQAHASDAAGDVIYYSLISPPSWLSIDRMTGLVTGTPTSVSANTITIRATDEYGASVDQIFHLVVYDPQVNRPPQFNNQHQTWAVVGQQYQYSAAATDPQNLSLSYSIQTSLTDVQFNPSTGLFIWTPGSNDIGDKTITFKVSNGVLTQTKVIHLNVRTNAAPTLASIPNQTLTAGQSLQLDVVAADADSDPLTYTLIGAPSGMQIDGTGQVTWANPVGTTQATIKVSDGYGGETTRTLNVTVNSDTSSPTVSLTATPGTAQIHLPTRIVISATDNVAITKQTLTIVSRTYLGVTTTLNTNIPLSSAGIASVTLDELGTYSFVAQAWDPSGNSTTQSLQLVVSPDALPPTITFTSPVGGTTLTQPTSIIGSVQDETHTIQSWQLVAYPEGGGDAITIGSGTSEVTSASLGFFDTTIVANGAYRLVLTATDGSGNTSSNTLNVEVRGNLKLGNFSIGFTDLQINTPGIPIKVSRTYNTLNAGNSLSFGNGWSLDLGNPKVTVSYPNSSLSALGNYIPFRTGTRVVITLPDGTSEGFTFQPIPIIDDQFGLFPTQYRPYFVPDAGVTDFLEVNDVTLTQISGSDEFFIAGQAGVDHPYNPTRVQTKSNFTLYTKSGVQYGIDPTTPGTTWIQDTHGNKVTYTNSGVTSSNGQSITFEHTNSAYPNVITAINIPGDGSTTNQILFGYDSIGNLTTVTDQTGYVTTYHYADARFPKFLTGITNALGQTSLSVTYDAQGRATQSTDAAGNVTTYAYSVGQKTQTVTNALGQSSTSITDAKGNVIEEISPAGHVTRQFDDNGHLKSQTINGLTTTYTYNSYGQLTSTTDPRGNTTSQDYDDRGYLYVSTDALGNSTTYKYDTTGNLIQTLTNGIKTTFTYDATGNLKTATDNSGQRMALNEYNSLGQLISTTDLFGNVVTFGYNATGQQNQVTRTSTDGTVIVKTTDTTVYDDAGRVKGTTRTIATMELVGGVLTPVTQNTTSSTVLYNANGQVIESTDSNGLKTLTTYDTAGRVIETRSQRAGSDGVSVWYAQRTTYDALGRVSYATETYREGTALPILGSYTHYNSLGQVDLTQQLSGVVINLQGSGNNWVSVLASASTQVVLSTSSSTFDTQGRVATSTDNYGKVTRYTYNKFGDLVQTVTDAGNSQYLASRTVYDSFGRAFASTNRYLSDFNGNPLTNGSGQTLTTIMLSVDRYDANGRVTTSTQYKNPTIAVDLNGNSSISQYGTQISQSTTVYDAQGRVIESTSADGQKANFEYDNLGRKTATITTPVTIDGQVIRNRSETVYDSKGRVYQQITNITQYANGTLNRTAQQTATYTYDAIGNVVRTTFTDGTFVETAYDWKGQKTSETDAAGNTKANGYDAQGRLTSVTMPAVPDPTHLDTNGNPVLTNPVYEYAYDSQGNQILIRDPQGRETWFTFDDRGNQLSRTLPLGFGADGERGTSDDPTSWSLGSGVVPTGMTFTERMTYDDMGRQKLSISFEGRVTEYVYGSDGRLSQQRFFDSLSQYSSGTGTPSVTWTYTYDAFGRQKDVTKYTAITATTITESKTYDSLGYLASTTTAEGTVSYTYDVYGRLASTVVGILSSPQRVTSYAYDELGRLKTVVEDQTPAIMTDPTLNTSYAYTLTGSLDRVDLPNGTIEKYEYNSLNQLKKLTEFAPDATPNDLSNNPRIAQYEYTPRADGQRTQAIESFWNIGSSSPSVVNNFTWTYDGLNRLTSEELDSTDDALDYIEKFTFDLSSNRIGNTKDLGRDGTIDVTTTSTFDANDRLNTESKEQSSGDTFTQYTWTGTQQTDKSVYTGTAAVSTNRASSTAFAYDLAGRLAVATVTQYAAGVATSIQETTYEYNSSGIRTSATTRSDTNADGTFDSTTRTEFLNDANNHTGYSQVIRESHFTVTSGTPELTKTIDYTFGHTQISQTAREFDSSGSVTSSITSVFGHDGHGSVRVLTDMTAAIAQMYLYDAYGQMLALWNNAGVRTSGGNGQYADPTLALTNLLYSGEQFDTRIGQQYLRARYYDANTGRFGSLDPFYGDVSKPITFHKYLYTAGNPIWAIDPSGWEGDIVSQVGVQGGMGNLIAQYAPAIVRFLTPTFAQPFLGAISPSLAVTSNQVAATFFLRAALAVPFITTTAYYQAVGSRLAQHVRQLGTAFSTVTPIAGEPADLFQKRKIASSEMSIILNRWADNHEINPIALSFKTTLRFIIDAQMGFLANTFLPAPTDILFGQFKLPLFLRPWDIFTMYNEAVQIFELFVTNSESELLYRPTRDALNASGFGSLQNYSVNYSGFIYGIVNTPDKMADAFDSLTHLVAHQQNAAESAADARDAIRALNSFGVFFSR